MGKSLNFDYSKPILVSIMKFIIFQIIRKYNLLDSSFCISVYGEQSSTQEEEKKTKSSTSSAADKCSEVKDIMNKNLQALNERGEKIEELQDKSEQLKNQSKNFLANAQELNKMMKKKGFFGW